MSSQQVQSIIDALKHAAGYGWTTIVKQQAVIGVEGIVWCSLMALIGLACALTARHFWPRFLSALRANSEKYGWDNDTVLFFWFSVPPTLAALALLIIAPLLAVDALGHIVNPAGYAITSLLP